MWQVDYAPTGMAHAVVLLELNIVSRRVSPLVPSLFAFAPSLLDSLLSTSAPAFLVLLLLLPLWGGDRMPGFSGRIDPGFDRRVDR